MTTQPNRDTEQVREALVARVEDPTTTHVVGREALKGGALGAGVARDFLNLFTTPNDAERFVRYMQGDDSAHHHERLAGRAPELLERHG